MSFDSFMLSPSDDYSSVHLTVLRFTQTSKLTQNLPLNGVKRHTDDISHRFCNEGY